MNNPYLQVRRKKTSYKPLYIGCGIMLGVFLLGILFFIFIFNKLWTSSQNYENSLTTLTGTFESDSTIAGPISGRKAKLAILDYDKYISRSGKSGSSSYYEYLLFQPADARFHVNGKNYTVIGHCMHLYHAKKDILNAPVLKFQCSVYKKQAPEIPSFLKGINHSMDYTFEILERGSCEGDRTRITLREYLYFSDDTISIRGYVRNDTLFLEE